MILGIDTSCYTTSLALVDKARNLILEERKLLLVEEGDRGLRQSKALFQQLNNLPLLTETLFQEFERVKIEAIAVSSRPRPVENSYMPVFLAGANIGKVLASTLKVPLIHTTHQEGHIEAGLWSAQFQPESEFLVVHISGGTTEFLRVSPFDLNNGYKVEKLGGSMDLHAGQFVDRIGVAVGFGFPAGPKLEELAKQSMGDLRIGTSIHGYDVSFSGPEAAAQRLLAQGRDEAEVARAVEHNIATSIEKILRKILSNEKCQAKNILIVGGVAANSYIRERLIKRLEHRAVGAKIYFAQTRFSSDNAIGVALIGQRKICGLKN